jgi:hypothetical protein
MGIVGIFKYLELKEILLFIKNDNGEIFFYYYDKHAQQSIPETFKIICNGKDFF